MPGSIQVRPNQPSIFSFDHWGQRTFYRDADGVDDTYWLYQGQVILQVLGLMGRSTDEANGRRGIQ